MSIPSVSGAHFRLFAVTWSERRQLMRVVLGGGTMNDDDNDCGWLGVDGRQRRKEKRVEGGEEIIVLCTRTRSYNGRRSLEYKL